MKKAIIRMTTLVLSLALVLSFSLSVSATEGQMTLKEVFLEAQANYSMSPARYSADDPGVSPVYYEEQEMPDGSTLIVTGYPTDYTNDETPLEPGQQAEGYIYALSSNLLVNEEDTTQTWGYLFSRIKYYSRSIQEQGLTINQKRMDSISYELEPASGYSFSDMEVHYISIDGLFNDFAENTFTTSQLVMTNFPTTSMIWVSTNAGYNSSSAVSYSPVFNGREYYFEHFLVSRIIG